MYKLDFFMSMTLLIIHVGILIYIENYNQFPKITQCFLGNYLTEFKYFKFDVAMITLVEPFRINIIDDKINAIVNPICLPYNIKFQNILNEFFTITGMF